jgi:ferredoxin
MDVEAPIGTTFIDLVEACGADITFGCRNGTCGTCRIRIDEGFENLSPKGKEESDFLQSLEADKRDRLACQAKILGDVKLSYVG